MSGSQASCLFCLEEGTGELKQVCFCTAKAHTACLVQYVEEANTRCPICRRPLRPETLADCFRHSHARNLRNMGLGHMHTKMSQLNYCSALAMCGRQEESLQELSGMRAKTGTDLFATVVEIEYANVLIDLGCSARAIRILHDVLAEMSSTRGSCHDRRFIGIQAHKYKSYS